MSRTSQLSPGGAGGVARATMSCAVRFAVPGEREREVRILCGGSEGFGLVAVLFVLRRGAVALRARAGVVVSRAAASVQSAYSRWSRAFRLSRGRPS